MCVLLLCLLVLCACCFCCVFVVFCVFAGFGVYFAFVFAGFWLLLVFCRAVYLLVLWVRCFLWVVCLLFLLGCGFVGFGLVFCFWLGAFGFCWSSRLLPTFFVGCASRFCCVSCFHLFSSFFPCVAPVSSLLSWSHQMEHLPVKVFHNCQQKRSGAVVSVWAFGSKPGSAMFVSLRSGRHVLLLAAVAGFVGLVCWCACWFCCVVCLSGLWVFVGCVFVGGDCEG